MNKKEKQDAISKLEPMDKEKFDSYNDCNKTRCILVDIELQEIGLKLKLRKTSKTLSLLES